jgi:flagellar hook-length control protein FliK
MNIASLQLALMLSQEVAPEQGTTDGAEFAHLLTEAEGLDRPPPGPEPPPIHIRSEMEAQTEPNAHLTTPDSLRPDESNAQHLVAKPHVAPSTDEQAQVVAPSIDEAYAALDRQAALLAGQGLVLAQAAPSTDQVETAPVAKHLRDVGSSGTSRSTELGARRDLWVGPNTGRPIEEPNDLPVDLRGTNRSEFFSKRSNMFPLAEDSAPSAEPILRSAMSAKVDAELGLAHLPDLDLDEDMLDQLRITKLEADRFMAGSQDRTAVRSVMMAAQAAVAPVPADDTPDNRTDIAIESPAAEVKAPTSEPTLRSSTLAHEAARPVVDAKPVDQTRPQSRPPAVAESDQESSRLQVDEVAQVERQDSVKGQGMSDEAPQAQAAAVNRSETRSAVFASQPQPLGAERRDLVLRQVADRIEYLAAARPKDGVTIQLNPIELGTIMLKINSRGNEVEAQIQASNEQVRFALEHSRPQLAQTLESRGLSLGNVTISGSTGHQAMADQGFRNAQHQADQAPQHAPFFGREVALGGLPTDWRSATRKAAGVDLWI